MAFAKGFEKSASLHKKPEAKPEHKGKTGLAKAFALFNAPITKSAMAPAITGAVKSLASPLSQASKGVGGGLLRAGAAAAKKAPATGGLSRMQAQKHIASLPTHQAARLESKLYKGPAKTLPQAKSAPAASAAPKETIKPSVRRKTPASSTGYGAGSLATAGGAGLLAGHMMGSSNNNS